MCMVVALVCLSTALNKYLATDGYLILSVVTASEYRPVIKVDYISFFERDKPTSKEDKINNCSNK